MMLKNPIFRVFLIFLVTSFLNVEAEARTYNVCTVSINSTEEIEVAKRFLEEPDFEFIELTQFGNPKSNDTEEWFDYACESGVVCDVLIVSGHFGGEFFGHSKLTLGTKKLEKYSCQNSCSGITQTPIEVFLFGCNTLAGKPNENPTIRSRNRQEQLQVYIVSVH